MKISIKLIFSGILLMFILSSCVDNIGPRGPRGPSGYDGFSDIKVITFPIYYDEWYREPDELNFWSYNFPTTYINYDVLDQGAVLFYIGDIENDGYVNRWFFIPFTNIYLDESVGRYYERILDAEHSFNLLRITFRDLNSQYYDFPDLNDIMIKAVILQGNATSMKKIEEIDKNDYEKVKEALNLQD